MCAQEAAGERDGGAGKDEEEGERPPSDYDAAGVLTTPLASFSELRLLRAGAPPGSNPAGSLQGLEADAGDATAPAAPAELEARQQAGAVGPDRGRDAYAPAAAAQGPVAGPGAEARDGNTPSRGILRVPQPPARQAAPGLSPSPDPGPDPRSTERAASAARRAMASGLAPMAVMRRMRGAGGQPAGAPAGAPAGGATAEGAADMAPPRLPQRAPSAAAGERIPRGCCVSAFWVLEACTGVPAAACSPSSVHAWL